MEEQNQHFQWRNLQIFRIGENLDDTKLPLLILWKLEGCQKKLFGIEWHAECTKTWRKAKRCEHRPSWFISWKLPVCWNNFPVMDIIFKCIWAECHYSFYILLTNKLQSSTLIADFTLNSLRMTVKFPPITTMKLVQSSKLVPIDNQTLRPSPHR